MDPLSILSLASSVITRLLPIAESVYDAVKDKKQPKATADKALALIKRQAKKQGLTVGNTEAELARTALHFALSKKRRHKRYTR